jgi:hypothetical protein
MLWNRLPLRTPLRAHPYRTSEPAGHSASSSELATCLKQELVAKRRVERAPHARYIELSRARVREADERIDLGAEHHLVVGEVREQDDRVGIRRRVQLVIGILHRRTVLGKDELGPSSIPRCAFRSRASRGCDARFEGCEGAGDVEQGAYPSRLRGLVSTFWLRVNCHTALDVAP